ncbi:MAG TPA: hypothetical protein VFH37_01290 [Candidatus Saccharimonadales bacterium]|nr:hypothetical protein [Candidatus Saccharimonadales bacterium]
MKVLVVNNNTAHMKNLLGALEGHEVEIQNYLPGINFHTDGKDVIVLSGGGGEGLEVNDNYKPGHPWYQDEMNLVRTATKPVVGICMGFEVMVRAFGGKVTGIGQLIQGFNKVEVSDFAYPLVGEKNLEQFESHSWRVKEEDVPEQFQKLAKSDIGVEIIKYNNLIATQFHPEKGGTLKLQDLLDIVVAA